MLLSERRVLYARVIADISARDILFCSIINPKFLLQFHQFYTCAVKQIHIFIPNIINVSLLRVIRHFWLSHFLTRRFPTSQICANRMLLTTTLPNDLLYYVQAIVITSTSGTIVTLRTKRHLAIAVHDVEGWLGFRRCCYLMKSAVYRWQGIRWCWYRSKIVVYQFIRVGWWCNW